MFFDRRKSPRKPVEILAWIAFTGGAPFQSCSIKDLSEEGARVWTANSDVLSDRLDICFSPDGADRRTCEVVWRFGNQMGVRFQG